MSSECGLCEISTRQTGLIETCEEVGCPYKRPVDPKRTTGPDARPLSDLSHREMLSVYNDEDAP